MTARIFVHPAVLRTVSATATLADVLSERNVAAVIFDHPPRKKGGFRLSELVTPVDCPEEHVYRRMDGEYLLGAGS